MQKIRDTLAHYNCWNALGDYNFTASEVLFALDAQAYAVECKAFVESEAEPLGEKP